MEGDLAVLNLPAIETTLRDLQRAFPQINMGLFDQRDPLDDNVLSNMLEGYAMVDRLLCDGVDIFTMGQLHYWLELNTIVLCGRGAPVRTSHHRLIEATETRFYEQPDGGIRDNMDWYALLAAAKASGVARPASISDPERSTVVHRGQSPDWRCIPNGRGRHSEKPLRRHPAIDRGTATAAPTSTA
jgi:hypothetical protein